MRRFFCALHNIAIDFFAALHNIPISETHEPNPHQQPRRAQEMKMSDKFPFAFDVKAMTETFKVPGMDKFFEAGMPNFDFTAMQEAQKKNVAALVEANKIAVSGYQAVYKRQTELFEAALADSKDRMSALQGKPMTVEAASENMETMKTVFESALADIKEIAEMAQTANEGAFEVLKARTEEVMAEIKEATDKLAA